MAAGLADVLVRHPDPFVVLGVEQHLLDEAAILLLHLGALAQRVPRVGHTGREFVAELLELCQRQDARTGLRRHAPLEALARPDGAEELRELLLEPRDLVAQRSPRRALVGAGPLGRNGAMGHLDGHVSDLRSRSEPPA
jgi:hypothetical protein